MNSTASPPKREPTNVLDAKSEATPETTADNITGAKPANVQPKTSTSKVDAEMPVPTSKTKKKEQKKVQKTQRTDSVKATSADFEMDTSI